MSPTAAQKRVAKEKLKREEEEAAKAAEESEASWYDMATPAGDFLPKLEGINYYELNSEGELTEGTAGDPPRKTQNVHFDAIHHESTNIRGKAHPDSPDEPVESVLSIPLSAARKLRTEMEEKKIKQSDLVGMILVLQRTGEKIKTRYPSIELLDRKEYFETE